MADYKSYALPEASVEQDYARQLAAAQLADRRQQQMAKPDRQRQARPAGNAGATTAVDGVASTAARQAYTRAWQLAEEGVQDFALTFMDLMLISGPAALAIFLTRLIGGNVLGGAGTISFREVTVPRVPGYSLAEGTYKFVKLAVIALVTGIIYLGIIFVVAMLTNPELLVQFGVCVLFGPILGFFGNTSCTAT